jgi:hypothetical protein
VTPPGCPAFSGPGAAVGRATCAAYTAIDASLGAARWAVAAVLLVLIGLCLLYLRRT